MVGRYLTRVKYHKNDPDNGERRVEYEPTLHRLAPPFVLHDSEAYAAATSEWVNVPLAKTVFKELENRGMSPGDNIPGTSWRPNYIWPDPEPASVVLDPAPQAEIDAWVAAGQALRSALTPAIVRHWKSHYEIEDDPVVRVANWLIDIVGRAEEILEGE